MCGRFTLTSTKRDLTDNLGIESLHFDFNWQPNYNVAPTQEIPVLIYQNRRVIRGMFWGLIPYWSNNMKIGNRMINAREETLTEKPAYASLVRSQRCIVIANGYYEWMQTRHGKKPYYIHDSKNDILLFAGLWDRWKNVKKQYRMTCTIITTEASEQLKHIHSRMPLILEKERINEWINCNNSENTILQLLQTNTVALNYHPISTFVNNSSNNSKKCIGNTTI